MARHFGGGRPVHRWADGARALLVFGLAFALLFVILSALFVYSGKAKTPAPVPVLVVEQPAVDMIDVLIPVASIEAGEALEPQFFRRESRPRSGLSDQVVRTFEEVNGYYSRTLIPSGQPLHRDFLTRTRPTNAITKDIPEGYRAVTIRVDATTSVEGWARAGAHVDVVWGTKIRGRPAVAVIVQNARVLSAERQVETNTKPGMPVPSTVTLLVTAQDAQRIQLAQSTGHLTLQLRGDSSTGKADGSTAPITVEELLNESRPESKRHEGTIQIGGELFVLREGKLVPADE